jgi:hypothetical protein
MASGSKSGSDPRFSPRRHVKYCVLYECFFYQVCGNLACSLSRVSRLLHGCWDQYNDAGIQCVDRNGGCRPCFDGGQCMEKLYVSSSVVFNILLMLWGTDLLGDKSPFTNAIHRDGADLQSSPSGPCLNPFRYTVLPVPTW